MTKKSHNRFEIIEHLKMIQNVIARVNGNSFLLKRWSIILLIAVLIYLPNATLNFSWLIAVMLLLPFIFFWLLDSFYLWQERGYVQLHNDVRVRNETDFAMRAKNENNPYCQVVFSKTILPFYASELIVLFVVFFLQPKGDLS